MNQRARQSQPQPLGEILQKILKKRNIPHHVADRQLLALWSRAVGPQIAAQTHPECLKRGSLYVRVSSPVWMHQLQFLKEEILEKLKTITDPGQIHTLFFSIGEMPKPLAWGRPTLTDDSIGPPLAPRDLRQIQECLTTLSDPELREILERVMTQEIRRRRLREKRQGY